MESLLRDVSRTFYKTLRVLPGPIRPQVGLAYLLARTTDTIADTEIVPLARRLKALDELRVAIRTSPLPHSSLQPLLKDFTSSTALTAEHRLLQRIDEALSLLSSFSAEDQRLIRNVLEIISSGQELDLQRFAGASGDGPLALRNDAELDDYTYRVAGCVGEFWTKMCRTHLFPRAKIDDAFLLQHGVRFGKGLQLVNILRDLPADLRKGRCYVPQDRLAEIGLTPAELMHDSNWPRFHGLYFQYLNMAEAHLAAGWAYTNALPWGCIRVRLACSWPILIGIRTIRALRRTNVLDGQQRVKISRQDVRKIVQATVVWYPLPAVWRRLFYGDSDNP